MAVPGEKTRMKLGWKPIASLRALEYGPNPGDLTAVSLHGVLKARFSGPGRRHCAGLHVYASQEFELRLMKMHWVGIHEIIHFPDLGGSSRGGFGDRAVPRERLAVDASRVRTIAQVIVEKAYLPHWRVGTIHLRVRASAVGKSIRRCTR